MIRTAFRNRTSFSAINYLYGEGRLSEREATQLLGTTMRLVNRSARAQKRLVIKFRAQCIGIAELMYRQYPTASFIFMYRNAIDCVNSYLRVFGALPLPEQLCFAAHSPMPNRSPRNTGGSAGWVSLCLSGWSAPTAICACENADCRSLQLSMRR